MIRRIHRVWFPLLLTISCITSAQDAGHTEPVGVRHTDEAEQQYLTALEVATKSSGDNRRELYRINLGLAGFYEGKHQYAEAEKYQQASYDIAKSAFGEQSKEGVEALYGLGELRVRQGSIWDGNGIFQRALKILESGGGTQIQTATVLNDMAIVHTMTGNHSKAVTLLRKAVGILEMQPTAAEEMLGVFLCNLATTLREIAPPREAMVPAKRAVSILERGKDAEGLAMSLVVVGRIQLDQGNMADSELLLKRALAKVEASGKQDGPAKALIFGHLGLLYGKTGRHQEAEPYYLRAVDLFSRSLGPEHPKVLDAMSGYAEFLRATKRKGEAKKLEAYVHDKQEKHRLNNPEKGNIIDIHSLMKRAGR